MILLTSRNCNVYSSYSLLEFCNMCNTAVLQCQGHKWSHSQSWCRGSLLFFFWRSQPRSPYQVFFKTTCKITTRQTCMISTFFVDWYLPYLRFLIQRWMQWSRNLITRSFKQSNIQCNQVRLIGIEGFWFLLTIHLFLFAMDEQ